LIKAIPKDALREIKIAAFDTRIALETINSKVLKKIVHTGGYASKPIAKRLVKKGAQQIAEPEGFIVLDNEGPLKENELTRAKAWGKSILESCS
jgi:hypothetical protein